jgi:hypothetical protein
MTSDEVIEKLTAATEGSRELDLWISYHFGKHGTTAQHNDAFDCVADRRKLPALKWLLAYTTSLDAALMLTQGHEWALWMVEEGFICRITKRSETIQEVAPTPALALCIASLKAAHHEG